MNQQVLGEIKETVDGLRGYKHRNIIDAVSRLDDLLGQLEANENEKTHEQAQAFVFEGIDPLQQILHATHALTSAKELYEKSFDFVGKQDRVTQDLLHKMELNDLDEDEMTAIALEIKQTRIARRNAKDFNDLIKPLSEFAEKNEYTVARLNEIERSTRSFIDWKTNKRKYVPREIQEATEDQMNFQAEQPAKAPTVMELAFAKASNQ